MSKVLTDVSSPRFVLLGSGRLAHHLQFYFKSLALPITFWSRNGDPQYNSSRTLDAQQRLMEVCHSATHILFAVSDSAIGELSAPWLNRHKTLVHFSGALHLPGVHSVHPLMTFGSALGDLDWYRSIPLIIEEGHPLSELLPGVPNFSWSLPSKAKAFYHALCSLAGNSSFLLWQKVGDEFEQKLNLPRTLLSPYLQQVVINASGSTPINFTGPVARSDWSTVELHLQALSDQPELQAAYRGYLQLAQTSGHPIPEAFL